MSVVPSLIADWVRLKLNWGYLAQQSLRPFILAPNEEKQLPTKDFTFSYPEGILMEFSAGFDHPNCGVRAELNPELDWGHDFTITNIALGLTRPEALVYAVVPPTTPPGYYGIRVPSAWIFKDWMKLYVFNADAVPHTCFAQAYHLAVLKEPRPDDRIVPLKDMAQVQQMLELYPELREPLRRRLADEAEQFIKDMRLKVKLEAD